MPTHVPPSDRSHLLSRLREDQSRRWSRGEHVPVESYLVQHPSLANDPKALVELIYAEILLRAEEGDTPRIEEYLARFPDHAGELRLCWADQQFVAETGGLDGRAATADLATLAYQAERGSVPLPSLPGYEVLNVLGEGGMGIVFRARQIAFDRLVAIKMIRSQLLSGASETARFRTEAQAIGRLDHPHVVRVFAFGEEQGCPFFAMEYLSGGSLSRLLRQGVLQVQRAAELVRQVALGIQAAHDRHILHRDLKPGNILLDARGHARVSDFGLAKLLDADSGATVSEAVIGTPMYMAPEQAAGKAADIGRATDVWALGIILYECLTGKAPFRGATRQDTLRLVQMARPVAPRSARPEVPHELNAICLKCLEKEPGQRYASASALADDLRAWQEGRRPAACPEDSFLSRLGQHPRALLVGIAVVAALLCALILGKQSPATDAETRSGVQVLIGEKGLPHYAAFRLGGRQALLIRGDDGYCNLTSTRLALLDLAPGVTTDRYRIHMQIRHDSSLRYGGVGLYFGASEHASHKGTIHRFFRISFNDLQDENDDIPPAIRHRVRRLKGNKFWGTLYSAGDLPDGRFADVPAALFFSPEMVKPSGHDGRAGAWRTVKVEVSPERIRVFWEKDTLVCEIPAVRLRQGLAEALNALTKRLPDHPAIHGLPARFDPRGAVGIYLFRGSASFRQARIEPLAGEE